MGFIGGFIGGSSGCLSSSLGVPAMARKANNPTMIMLVQQMKPEYWTHAAADPVLAALIDQAHAANVLSSDDPARIGRLQEVAAAIGSYIVSRWEADGLEIEDAHAILHGDDTRQVWDELQGAHVTVLKFLHIHLLVKFRSREASAPTTKLAARAGVSEQCIELDKSRGGAHVEVCGKKVSQQHDNGLAYLIHAKYTDKFQYPPTQVASVRGMDYQQVYRERYPAWVKGRAHIKKKRAAMDVDELLEKVLQGEITRDQIMLTDELFDVFARYQRDIEDALSAYGQRRAYRAAAKLRAGDFSTQVVYIHGDAGVGKTRFAQEFIRVAIKAAGEHGQRWQLYRAATGNPLDAWRGEEVMLLDDLRASAMDANDWLLLLDPYNASPAKARYKNKGEVAPRLIVITATIEPVEFFFFARQKGNVDEALDQFIRRLQSVVRVFRKDDIVRYFVQRIGKIEPYEWKQPYRGTPSMFENAKRELTFGPESAVEHSTSTAAVSDLVLGLVDCSRDIPFHDPTHRQLAAFHDDLTEVAS